MANSLLLSLPLELLLKIFHSFEVDLIPTSDFKLYVNLQRIEFKNIRPVISKLYKRDMMKMQAVLFNHDPFHFMSRTGLPSVLPPLVLQNAYVQSPKFFTTLPPLLDDLIRLGDLIREGQRPESSTRRDLVRRAAFWMECARSLIKRIPGAQRKAGKQFIKMEDVNEDDVAGWVCDEDSLYVISHERTMFAFSDSAHMVPFEDHRDARDALDSVLGISPVEPNFMFLAHYYADDPMWGPRVMGVTVGQERDYRVVVNSSSGALELCAVFDDI